MNTQTRSILAIMAVVFAAALAVLWPWQKAPGPAPVPVHDPAPVPAPAPEDAAPVAARLALAPPPDIVGPAHAAGAGGGSPRPAMVIPPSNLDGPALPIVFSITHRPGTKSVEDASGEETEVPVMLTEGVVLNRLRTPLTLTVMEVGQETTQAQITLAGGMQKRFGVDQGLRMLAGDVITLRSPNYRDITQTLD